jgi:hypothetical protein
MTTFITRRLRAGIFMVLLLLIMLLAFYSYQVAKIQHISTQQVPTLLKNQQIQQQLFFAQLSISHLLQAQNAEQILTEHKKLAGHWQKLAVLTKQQNKTFNDLTYLHQNQQNTAMRLTENFSRNRQLKQLSSEFLLTAQQQLQLVLAKKQQQQQSLLAQIRNDRLLDSVTSTRARAHATLMTEIVRLVQLQANLKQLEMFVSEFSLQVSETQFENFSQLAVQTFSTLATTNDYVKNSGNQDFIQALTAVDELFFSQQQLIAKWRGQLRLFNEYRQYLVKANIAIQPLLARNPIIEETTGFAEKSNQLTFFQRAEQFMFQQSARVLKHVPEHYLLPVFISLIVLVFMVLLLTQYAIKKANRNYHQQTLALIKSQLEHQEHTGVSVNYYEQAQLMQCVDNVIHPEHSEQQFIALTQQLIMHQQIMHQWQKCMVWTTFNDANVNPLFNEQKRLLDELLIDVNSANEKTEIATAEMKRWRDYFTADSVYRILKTARQVKQNQSASLLAVECKNGVTALLSIDFQNNHWLGSIANYQHVDKLNNKLQQVEQQAAQQQQALVELLTKQLQQSHLLLLQLMANSQIERLSHKATDYQTSIHTLNVLNQQLSMTLPVLKPQLDQTLTLQSCRFDTVVQSIILTLYTQLNATKYKLTHRFDEHLIDKVMLDVPHFESLLLTLTRVLLGDNDSAKIHLNFSLQDKRPGQQIVNISLICLQRSSLEKVSPVVIPKIIRMLCQNESTQQTNVELVYLQQLMALFNITDLSFAEKEQGFQLQFSLPVALAENAVLEDVQNKILSSKVLLICQNKTMIKLISAYLKPYNIELDVIALASHFCQQFDVKRLSKRKLDLVILASDSISTGFSQIKQHIAQLPNQYQPKCFALQEQNSTSLNNQGLFSQSVSPLFFHHLIDRINEFLAGEKLHNQILNQQQLAENQFKPNYVEVLLAVQMPAVYQPFYSLLKYLGFTVSVVSDAISLQQHWQSGRYLVLFSDIALPDTTQFWQNSVQQTDYSRQVVLLNQILFEQNKAVKAAGDNHVEVCCLLNCYDLPTLVQLLTPWLNAEIPTQKQAVSKQHHISDKKHKTSVTQQKNVSDTESKPPLVEEMSAIDEDIQEDFMPVLALEQLQQLPHENTDNPVINLQQYAINQGSAEMAAFMLEQYIADAFTQLTDIKQAVQAKDWLMANSALLQLQKTAKILAANALQQALTSLQQLIEKQSDISIDDVYVEIEQTLNQLVKYSAVI